MEQKNELNSFSVILFAWEWRKPLLAITFLSGILAFLAAMFIQPKYKSTAIVFAPQFNSFIVDYYDTKNDLRRYGEEHETEQLLQIINSRDFLDTLVRQFNLIEYYDINTEKKYWKNELYNELDGNIKIKRTQYGGILISVFDKDPQHAAILANAIVDELDHFKNRIDNERTNAACELLQKQMDEVREKLLIVNDSVMKLANKGIFIYDLQVERVMQQYAIALGQGNSVGAQRLQKEIEKIAKWGPKSVLLREELIYLARREAMLKTLLWNAEMNASGVMPTKFVVEKAIPMEKKVYPKKSLIAFLSAIGAFIATFFVLLTLEKIKTEIPTYKKEEE
jgi:uncharacterized protein involved in exopolysaccharide biosynthesis